MHAWGQASSALGRIGATPAYQVAHGPGYTSQTLRHLDEQANQGVIMSTRKGLAIAIAAALAVPAIALAEVGPHSTWYAVHKTTNGRQNNINIVYQRNNGRADVNGVNSCLGTSTPQGSKTAYPNSFDAYPVAVKHGKIAFQGRATVYIGMNKTRPRMIFSATLKPNKAVGQVSFPGTKCGTIHFTAPVALVKK